MSATLALIAGAEARLETQNNYGNPYDVGDNSDAFRHALWGYLSAQRTGYSFATTWTDAHEYAFAANFYRDSFLETKMDLLNNAIGIETAPEFSISINAVAVPVVKVLVNGGNQYIIKNNVLVPSGD